MENKDDIYAAVEGLIQFRHNFCVNWEKSMGDDLSFNCCKCHFETSDGRCLAKGFIRCYGTKDQRDRSQLISR